jgi:Holliday junction resolvasome RuvABC endonuclease subunit
MIVVGIDPSTWVGLARSDGHGDIMGKCVHVDLVGWERVQLIAENVYRTLEVWEPELAVIENYALGMKKSPDTLVTLIAIGTMIRSSLYNLNIPWIEIRPSTLKKWTTGKGNAKKPQMAEAVKNRWGYTSPSDDIVDAAALAEMGHILVANGLKNLPDGVKHGLSNFQA